MKKSIMRTTAIALTLAMTMSVMAFGASVPSDVEGKPYEAAVSTLMDKKIITGDQDGLFHPDDTINRAQACIISVKAMNPPATEIVGTPTQSPPLSGFSDMLGYKWAEGYVNYAVVTGVTKGYGNGKFGPSDKVSTDQLATMILRAAGYTDNSLGGTWPENYVEKGEEVGLYDEISDELKRSENAPKWVAAQMTYNMLEIIEKAGVAPEEDATPDDTFVPGKTEMIFSSGSFNANMTSYSGREISSNVQVFTYGVQEDYSKDMEFPVDAEEYRIDTIKKYKNAETPCFYTLKNGEINNMIIPMDAGFSGRIYGVINSIGSITNGNGVGVPSYETLTAAEEITWLAEEGLAAPENYLDGTIFEMYAKNGEITAIAEAGSDEAREKAFEEISGSVFLEVEKFEGNVIKIKSDGEMFAVKSNAAVYVLSKDKKSYKVGSQSDIFEGETIRAYDITDDDDKSADLIVVEE